jgi:hypothetical protein
MADYEHDIFVSYRRSDADWVRWTKENFVRALRSLLGVRLGSVNIFIDEAIEDGSSWPNNLARRLSRSRLMVAVLSRDYFHSEWCRLELSLMHYREKINNLRNEDNPYGLIVPVVIDDGDCFPPEVQMMQGTKLHAYANPFMLPNSPRQEELAEELRNKYCSSIEHSLQRVPLYDPEWEKLAHDKFEEMFKIQVQSQKTLPSLNLMNQ